MRSLLSLSAPEPLRAGSESTLNYWAKKMGMPKILPLSAGLMGLGRAHGFRFSFGPPVVRLFFEKNLLERIFEASYFGGLDSCHLSMWMQFLIQ